MTMTLPLRLEVDPASLLELAPRMGRTMVIGQSGPVTHERIGVVEAVAREGGKLRLSGATQESEIAPEALASVIYDRSSEMQGKIYPRLEFRDAEGATVFAMVGMEGLEPFAAVLEDIAAAPEFPSPEEPRPEPRELAEDDPILPPFRALEGSGRRAVIAFARPGFTQFWRGEIAALRPSSGFLNVMTKDFHLHLRAGGVAGWEKDEAGASHALDAEGRRIGLSLSEEV
ncbi:hypothetical protein [Neomegalonema perideroedes]|uniref:hypothetical protein n=1 Tax=Neomegalonema perideroedes TaxID=217219 RepID=UPI000368300F|nr:hypothetical protein [Neomegalonema perideroedes]